MLPWHLKGTGKTEHSFLSQRAARNAALCLPRCPRDDYTYTNFDALRDSASSKIAAWDLSCEDLGPEIAKPLAEYISVSGGLTNLS